MVTFLIVVAIIILVCTFVFGVLDLGSKVKEDRIGGAFCFVVFGFVIASVLFISVYEMTFRHSIVKMGWGEYQVDPIKGKKTLVVYRSLEKDSAVKMKYTSLGDLREVKSP